MIDVMMAMEHGDQEDFYDSECARNFTLTNAFIEECEGQIANNVSKGLGRFLTPQQSDLIRKHVVRNWDLFYKRNTSNFFKDRMWLAKEFSDEFRYQRLCTEAIAIDGQTPSMTVLDLGCGVGNTTLPLLSSLPCNIKLWDQRNIARRQI